MFGNIAILSTCSSTKNGMCYPCCCALAVTYDPMLLPWGATGLTVSPSSPSHTVQQRHARAGDRKGRPRCWTALGATPVAALATVKRRTRRVTQKESWDQLNHAAELGDVARTKEIFWDMWHGTNTEERQSWLPGSDQRRAYNTVLKACANAADLAAAEEWYEILLAKGLVPNKETYGKLSEAAAWHQDPSPPRKQDMQRKPRSGSGNVSGIAGEKRQLEITPIAINILIDAAAKSPSAAREDADRVAEGPPIPFEHATCQGHGILQKMITRCTGIGFMSEEKVAEKFLFAASHHLVPNAVTYTALIDAYARNGNARRCDERLRDKRRRNLLPAAVPGDVPTAAGPHHDDLQHHDEVLQLQDGEEVD
eukprot:s988_g14.t1